MSELPINQLFCGDVVELTRELIPDNSIHAIVTDPPYGLEFMGEEWDKPNRLMHSLKGETYQKRFENITLPRSSQSDFKLYQQWTTSWAKEALRVLKPGASMLVMGGTRTYHRMACGVEDAGFIIKDCLAWCYNSGFPKAQDLGKMIDKRAPRRGMFTKFAKHYGERRNVKGLTHNAICEHGKFYAEYNHGGASVNWEAGYNVPTLAQWNILQPLLGLSEDFLPLIQRVEAERKIIGKETNKICFENLGSAGYKGEWNLTSPATSLAKKWDGWKVGTLKPSYEPVLWTVKPPEGSYIDNVLKHGVGAVNVDGCRIPYESEDDFQENWRHDKGGKTFFSDMSKPINQTNFKGRYPANMIRTDRFHDGYDRFYFISKAGREERWFKCKVCVVCQDGTHLRDHDDHALHCHECGVDFQNTEAGREAHKNHRTESNIIGHPTVKPVSLGEHLIKLVTREGQIVVDFFAGLGSFPEAARRQNRHYIGFDNNAEYIEISKHRLAAIPKSLEAYSERIEV